MIEILMLYTIYKRERTIYGIRKEIIDLFGTFTEPSIGTIYPSLKRLLKDGAVDLSEKMSEGGRKSSYYSITAKGKETFKNLFFNDASDNPSLFFNHIQARLGTMSVLDEEDRKKFIYDSKKRIEFFEYVIEKKLNDEFSGLNYYQKLLHKRTLEELKSLYKLLENLKTDEKD